MSTAYSAGVNDVVQTGIENGTIRVGIMNTQDDTRTGYNNLSNTTGSNPRDISSAADYYTISGTQILSVPQPTFESNADGQVVEEFKVRYDPGDATWHDFAAWNGFSESFDLGKEITFNDFDVECDRAGVAEAFHDGANNLTATIYLLDGSLNRHNEAWAEASPGISADSSGLYFASDQSFTNNTGASRTVGGVEVVWGSGNIILSKSHTNATLADGDTITYTTLEAAFSGLQ